MLSIDFWVLWLSSAVVLLVGWTLAGVLFAVLWGLFCRAGRGE